MENAANYAELRGRFVTLPALSHENHGRKFYHFMLEVDRLSGATDTLKVIVPEDVLFAADLTCGDRVTVQGQVRSYNSRMPCGRKLHIFIYAETMVTSSEECMNCVRLTGAICKAPVFRRTPLGREICDVMLTVRRAYHRTDYLPCILWGATAQMAAQLPVGTCLELEGRLQSREYTKLLETGAERRTAYEVSALHARIIRDTEEPIQ